MMALLKDVDLRRNTSMEQSFVEQYAIAHGYRLIVGWY